ncbi:MAG: ornithine cyclodeaminase family protein [SAR202 cluster bacterium]|nr:ornithine cyclodeaminase family protein [SAR202 cluster bacterium]|tara:strand:+ start:11941 stop:12888 length:948 start_codon:yes stop_codon:yes gene_type:complete
MTIFLSESDVVGLLDMAGAIDALEKGFKEKSAGTAVNLSRVRPEANGVGLTMMVSILGSMRVSGFKVMGAGKPLVLLYGGESKTLLAVIEASSLGQRRTGAASGLATKYMAAAKANTVGIVGTGFQARSQLEAVCTVRNIEAIKAFSRNQDKRKEFATIMSDVLGIDVIPVDSAEEAVKDTDIVVTITNVRTLDPVVLGDWIKPGSHINAAGANSLSRRELDETTILRSAMIAVDDLDQAKIECADLVMAVDSGVTRWDQIVELSDIVSGDLTVPIDNERLTLFESQGIALEDIAVAAYIYEKAIVRGIGETLSF